MAYDVTGNLLVVYGEQQVTDKFRKREFVLEIPGNYPEQVKFQLTQDRCDLIDPYRVGQQVTVSFNLRGRGFNKNGQMQYFTNLEAWKIQPAGGAAAPAQRSTPTAAANHPIASDDDNDLPF